MLTLVASAVRRCFPAFHPNGSRTSYVLAVQGFTNFERGEYSYEEGCARGELKHNGRTGGIMVRNKFGALLKGLVRCVCCDCAMTPNHTTKGGNKRYRYYVCTSAQKRGWHTCASKSIPAKQIEDFVIEQIKKIG